jgi:signal transduction histidine kinase
VQGKDEITELTVTFNEMLERLQAAFTSQRNFINDAGHELQTPITIVRGHLELLNEEIPPEQYEAVELVIDELDRMSRIVNELLLLAKAEQPDFLYLETVELSLLIEELYAKATALAFRDWHLDAKAAGKIVVDRQRITQAVVNLAQNATQHTKEGDTIALGSALTGDSVRFWVRDTGEGIALADQERIFQRFARGSNGRRRSEGAGLGLAIVRAIAEAHGGMVELMSQPGCGSTFTIVIPLKNPSQGIVS